MRTTDNTRPRRLSALRRGIGGLVAGVISLGLLGLSASPGVAETVSGESVDPAQTVASDGVTAVDTPEAGVDPGQEATAPVEGSEDGGGGESSTETAPGPAEGEGESAALEGANAEEEALGGAEGGPSAFASDRVQDNPVNPGTAGTGPNNQPNVTVSVTPTGAQGPGATRTYTVRYTNMATANNAASSIKNARVWIPFTVDADHVTTYTVSCVSSTTATGNNLTTCPNTDGMPAGPQTIVGEAGVPNNFLWGVVNIGRGNRYIEFTITATTLLAPQENACATPTVAVSATANYSLANFTTSLQTATASAPINSGQCANGAVTMTNTVTSPVSLGQPTRVLSGDPRVFEATWHNTTSELITLPIDYNYLVPSASTTEASWTCSTTTGACPDFGDSTTLTSDGGGSENLRVRSR